MANRSIAIRRILLLVDYILRNCATLNNGGKSLFGLLNSKIIGCNIEVLANFVVTDVNLLTNLLQHFSPFRKILGIVSYMLRFISASRANVSDTTSLT